MKFGTFALLALNGVLLSSPAFAYLGPGMGAGTLAVIFGLLASLFVGLLAVVWYPLKRKLKARGQECKEETRTPPHFDEARP